MSGGSLIAGQLASGIGDVLMVIGAVAVMYGVLLLWRYVKNSMLDDGGRNHSQAEYDEFYSRTGFRHHDDPER